jgi:hypothetical protein
MDLQLLRKHLDEAAHTELGGLSGEELCDAAVELQGQLSVLTAALGRVTAELDSRGFCPAEHGLPTSAWLTREAHIEPVRCRRRVRVATMLRDQFPHIAAAVADGRLSWDHADAVVAAANPRIRAQLAAVQDTIIAWAHPGSSWQNWHARLHELAEAADQDGPYDPNRDLARNRLNLDATGDNLHLHGELVGDDALLVEQAVETRANDLWRRYQQLHKLDPDIALPTRATLRALALAELIADATTNNETDTNSDRDHTGDTDPDHTDDTGDNTSGDNSDADPDNNGDTGGDNRDAKPAGKLGGRRTRTEVSVVIHAEDPLAGYDPHGVRLQDGTIRRLLCDADLYPRILDNLGVPLDMGRAVRFATAAQRRMLAARDGGCIFPGCDKPLEWCDIHHLDEFHLGGHTDLARLVCLCRFHHGVTHRHGWTLHAGQDGWFWWQTPSNRTFWSQRRFEPRTDPPPHPTPRPANQHRKRRPPPHTHTAG